MRKVAMILAAAGLLVGCVDQAPTDLSTLSPSELLAARRTDAKNYVAPLSGGEEVPANASLSRGNAIFQYDAETESIRYRLIVANLNNLTQAHIHVAPPGANGPVVVWLYPSAPPAQLIPGRTSGVVAEGTFTAADLRGPLAGQPFSALIAAMNAGNTYVNVHTVLFPPGEIRGQIQPGG
jgi:hypothetical protein